MDIDLLSKMVKELILTNNEVSLPPLGSFVAELIPSSFSDKGYTINPPYRRLYFRQKVGKDTILSELYASSNKISQEDATRILGDFLSELQLNLQEKKNVVFPGLGRLRATKENNFFFVPDEDLDIYPSGYGLEPISLKTHQPQDEQVATAVADIAAIIEDKSESTILAGTESPDKEVTVNENVAPKETASTTANEDSFVEEKVALQSSTSEAEQTLAIDIDQKHSEESDAIKSRSKSKADPDASIKSSKSATSTESAKKGRKILLWCIIGLIGLVILFLLIFILLAHVAPDFIDSILYTPDELRIINY